MKNESFSHLHSSVHLLLQRRLLLLELGDVVLHVGLALLRLQSLTDAERYAGLVQGLQGDM